MRLHTLALALSLLLLQLTIVNAQTVVYYGSEASALVKDASIVRLKGEEQHLSYVLYEEKKQPALDGFIEQFKNEFEIDEAYTFKLIDKQLDHLNQEHFRYQQFYNQVPIRTAHLVLHTSAEKVLSISGFIYKEPLGVSEYTLDESSALEKALETIPASLYKWQIPEEEAHLKREQKNSEATYYPHAELYYIGENLNLATKEQRLCYRFDIYAHEPLARQQIYVDVTNAEVIFKEDIIKHIDVPAIGATAYNGNQTMVVDSVSPNVFRLREKSRGQGIETYNLKGGTVYANAVDFIDSSNSWTAFNPAIDRYALDAHWGAEMTYDYFWQKHNRNSINNMGFALLSYVHYRENYVNAFWDGKRMTYGDGDNQRTPLTTLDITGHEITHGLTRFTSNLVYAKESGALNESFSDIFGVEVERFARPTNWNWDIGEQIGGAFRSFSNPNTYNDPDTYGGMHWHNQKGCVPDNSNDKCGVHSNSGVQNHWFYLLSIGGSGTNDIGKNYNVTGIGMDSAAAIAFRNNIVYLTPSSDYEDARFFSFRAAVDLFGACSPIVESTINAWYAVGVGEEYSSVLEADFIALNDTAFCAAPAKVDFISTGQNVYDFKWDFGDGKTSRLRSPSHTYTASGNYTVTLYADGLGCGKDTVVKQQYINIDTAIPCATIMEEGTQTVTTCEGRLYDVGGLNGNYEDDYSDTLHILPTSSSDYILFQFTSFDIEAGDEGFCNRDYIEIFDGPTVDYPSLGRFCNNILPPDSILSSSKALTVVFHTDRQATRKGYGAEWKCLQATLAPQIDFATNVDTTCNGEVKFYGKIVNTANTFFWDFGDGSMSLEKNPVHEYKRNGDYTVTFAAANSQGQDVIIKNKIIHVSRPEAPEVLDDTACYNGDIVLGVPVANKNRWYRDKNDEVPFYIGDTLRLNKIDSTQEFYVENAIEHPSQTVVPLTVPGNSYISDSTAAIYFDVYQPLTIKSVVIYVSETRHRTVELRNKDGVVIQSRDVYVRNPGIQVALDFELYPDTGYSITMADRDPASRINSDGASFPYVLDDLISINRSSLGGNTHPFFYYWTVQPLDCVSKKEKVTAFVDTSCVIVSVNNLSLDEQNLKVYPNPFTNQFEIELPKKSESFNLYLYDMNGRLILEERVDGEHQNHQINAGSFSNGIYLLKLIGKDGIYQQKMIKYNN